VIRLGLRNPRKKERIHLYGGASDIVKAESSEEDPRAWPLEAVFLFFLTLG